MKRIVYTILFLLVATSICAKKTTISFWHILGYHTKSVIEEIIAAYNDTHPNIYIKSDFQGYYIDAQVKLLTAAITKNLPDVAQIPYEFLQSYIKYNFIAPINNEIPEEVKSDVMDKMWELVERDGNIYGLPFCVITDVFYYNENIFLKSGLDPGMPPSTWDEMIQIGKKLTRDNNGDGILDSYALTFYLNGIYGIAPILWANGGSFLTNDGKKVKLASKEMEKTISMVLDLIFKHKIMPQKWTEWESAQAFLTGKLAMGWFLSAGISYSEENLPWTLRISHIPRFNGKRYGLLTGTALVNFAKNKRRRRAAKDFMLWLIQKENDIKLYEKIGFVPIRKSSLHSLELKAFAKANPNYLVPLEALEYARPLPNHPEFLKINQEISNMLQRIILDKADLTDELAKTERLINEMLE